MSQVVARLDFIAQLVGPSSVAVSSASKQLSYAELSEEVKRCSEWLAKLNSKVLAFHAENCVDWIIVDLACQEIGLPCIPLPTFFSPEQVNQCIQSSGVDAVVSYQKTLCQKLFSENSELLVRLPDAEYLSFYAWRLEGAEPARMPSGTQKITFTSGSTGNPKGVCLAVENQWSVAQSIADAIGMKQPKHLCLLPLSTLLENIAGVYSPLLCGGTVVIANDAERGMQGSSHLDVPVLLACIDRVQPTTMILIPQLLTVLLAACEQGWQCPASVKFVAVGGGKVSPEVIKKAQAYGVPVYQGYGLSECASVVALNTPRHCRADSVGHILSHCVVTIEDGEVVVANASHLGYLNEPDSWYPKKIYTGDIGRLGDGFLSIDGRKKNVLITAYGRNVSPEWVESEMMSSPLLSCCMVVGDEMTALGLLLTAPPHITDDAVDALIREINMTLPDYARVMHWLRLDEAEVKPYMTPNGRLQRHKMIDAYRDVIDGMYICDPLPKVASERKI